MRIYAENTMALVIDFQEKLMPVIYNNEELLHNTEILVKGLKTINIPMIVTQQYTKGLGMTVSQISDAFGEDFGFEDKVAFSCMDDETIAGKIEALGKKNVIICGVEAHICVLQTAIDLITKGYNVILVEDCVGSRKLNDKLIGVKRAISEGVIITTYESLLFELTRVAKGDVFKTISKLVK